MSLKINLISSKAKRYYIIDEYNKVENNVGDTYLYNASVETVSHEYKEPDYDIRMVCHIEEEENIDRDEFINLRIF